MACSSDFVVFAVELLSSVGPVSAKRMFGGHGVYARGVMFALLDDDELFLKVDGETRARFRDAGCRNWVYPGMAEAETSYYRPPDEAHDDPEAMAPWAQLGLEAALRARAAKATKATKATAGGRTRNAGSARKPGRKR